MGACLSLDQDERKARTRSGEIDRELQRLAREDGKVVRILLLGTAESGKSTLVKQMKIIHNDGFSPYELNSFQTAVLENLVGSMKYVLNGMGMLQINLENPANLVHARTVLACQRCYDELYVMLPFVSSALRALWADRGVRAAVARGFEYELNDSAIYYFENMGRICLPQYVPTPTDVLRARVRTTGIIETCFRMENFVFRLFDVGGQRSERRKWIQCFDDMQAILFVVALSGYDMTLYEDANVNRLEESLQLFSAICNNRFFLDTSMILFLNKVDLFREKILHSGRHLRFYFDYAGPDCHVDAAARHLQGLFLRTNRNSSKVIYPHFTTATDTSNIQVVFQVAMDTIVKENLKVSSLL